ncbi:MAG TPA: TonB-dependent receptor [Gemmatimonadales bacterium]|jgi:hypothetical protein|nr:TonB-dependent receptor [Gemmatimonadales bacterium]
MDRLRRRLGVIVALPFLAGTTAGAEVVYRLQGMTTAAVRGTLRMRDGGDPDGTRVTVRNTATGFVVEAEVRNGRFLVSGLEVGGPYTVALRRIGARPERRDIGMLSLGEPYELHLVLEPAPVRLDSLVVQSPDAFRSTSVHGGTAATIGDSLVHHLPSLDRNLYDFVRLVPQISTRVGPGFSGISGGGVGFRFNHFLTNGVPERSLAGGQPPEFAGGKSLPLEAVGEYQVLLAPFDVRYGDFAGAAVNTVTRAGTNRRHGSLFVQFRNDALARTDTLPYQRGLLGFSFSGPVVRDRAHFLIAGEFQRLTSPMAGPYVGQPASASAPVPVREADLERLGSIMQSYGLTAGSGEAVQNRNPLRNVFARLDAALPGLKSRAVLWLSDGESESLFFARQARDTTFALSSQATTSRGHFRTAALQVHTARLSGGGGNNEFFLSRRAISAGSVPAVRQPIVTVTVPAVTGGGTVSLLTGTPVQAQGADARGGNIDLRDNLTLLLGRSHVASVGVEAEWFRLDPSGLLNSYGTWSFPSLDALQAGLADRFEVARDLGGASVPLTGGQYGAYAGDQWQLGERLSLTLGIRMDLLDLHGTPPYNRAVDSIFGRRTDRLPGAHLHFSPRAGFTWTPDGTGRHQLRGGVGIFTGRPPLAWIHTPVRTYGFGSGVLRCTAVQGPPPFEPDPLAPPVSCASGSGGTPPGDVELLDPHLRMARTLRGVVAGDFRLPGNLVATAEALFTRNLSDFMFVNLNLVGPQSTDPHGRTLYGTIASNGTASPARRTTAIPSVIELQNVSANHSAQLAARLERHFSGGLSAVAAYTWSRVRDVQTPLRVNNRGVVNWSSRALSGRHEDLRAGISGNDIPHRVILAGTWRAPWPRWTTELSLLYVGESGAPFTYLAWGVGGLGDLNADGSNTNDPIYVPRNAIDPQEIRFSDPAQGTAFEQFVASTPCLRQQRGRILERNSCREPWSHTSVISLRQRVPLGSGGLEAQLDLLNPLNLLNGRWGQRRIAAPALLEQVGEAVGLTGSQPVFRFQSVASPWTIVPAESSFQLQLGVAYRF